ncbi:uncharacterized protein LOC127812298 isoform X2 [Diospyros lotus]|uniref:uncharacterized protein LOC127812298 isoform X2 n=1 Tax=Diospyros lotus TaxID=55363 RepID=UPI002251DF32|nr:uncharacterized protein LOC127812298 isoform X2 [Diospyros lotus]
MASAGIIPLLFAVFLGVQPWTGDSNILSPVFSPHLDDVCKGVECGKGTCKPSPNATYLFVCECDPGWKQTRPAHGSALKFIPCVVPNCSLDYSCTKAAPGPVQDKELPANKSFFNPCHWIDCGRGTCSKTSPFTHTCKCEEGCYNLFNHTAFPCLRDCSLGMDCSSLGITAKNDTSSTPRSSLADNGTNRAGGSIQLGGINWLILVVSTILASVQWK